MPYVSSRTATSKKPNNLLLAAGSLRRSEPQRFAYSRIRRSPRPPGPIFKGKVFSFKITVRHTPGRREAYILRRTAPAWGCKDPRPRLNQLLSPPDPPNPRVPAFHLALTPLGSNSGFRFFEGFASSLAAS